MNKLSFIFDGKFYTKSDVKIPDDKSSHSYVLGVINGIKTSSNKPLTAILFQQDALYTYGYEIPEKNQVIEYLWSLDLEGLKTMSITPEFIDMHIENEKSNTEYNEIELLKVHPEMYEFIPLKNEANVKLFLSFIIWNLNINFHPDDSFRDYLDNSNNITDENGKIIKFDDPTINFMSDLIDTAFKICGDKVYDFGFEFQQKKLAGLGIVLGGDVDEVSKPLITNSETGESWTFERLNNFYPALPSDENSEYKIVRFAYNDEGDNASALLDLKNKTVISYSLSGNSEYLKFAELNKNVDSDQLKAWLKRYDELPEGKDKEVAKEWVLSLGGSVGEIDRTNIGEENEPEKIALANLIINQVSNTKDLRDIRYLQNEIERYRVAHNLDIMNTLDVDKAILNILDEVDNGNDSMYDPERSEDYVDYTLISEELADVLMNFYFAWQNLSESWTANDGLVNLENLYPFTISFDDLKIYDWIKYITGNNDAEINDFSSRYNSVNLEGDLENFNNAFNEIINWSDENKFDDDWNEINDIIGSDNAYPFDDISLDDLQPKINEWVEASIKSINYNPLINPEIISEPEIEPTYGINGSEPVKVEETPKEWKERKNKEHEEEYKSKLELFLDNLPHGSINVKDVIDRDFKKSPQERYQKIKDTNDGGNINNAREDEKKILEKVLVYKEVLWAKVCKAILDYSFDWNSIKEEVLESHFSNERQGYVGMYSGDLTGHCIGVVKIDSITYYSEYKYFADTRGFF